jgi:uroporphyrinogen decarboxylase
VNAKENYLAAVRHAGPERVPLTNEPIWHTFQLEGNFCRANWTDGWGVGWEVGLEGTVPFPKGNPLPSLDRLADYRMPDPGDLVLTDEMRAELDAVDGGTTLVCGQLTYLLFERAWAIMGMDGFLTALMTHPDEAHAFCHGLADYARRVFDRYLELGVDAISFSEDLGTQRAPFMSPAMFREFLLPEYAHCFENILSAGKMVRFHSCGAVVPMVADLAELGVTVLNPVQARANDLAAVKRYAGGRMALAGAIDTALLAQGTPEQVRSEVERVMSILKPGGGYVCGPDQGIPGIPEENMVALWEAATALGRY